ncbi:MAG: DUF5946 family protein [Gemmatimonadales bacterium]
MPIRTVTEREAYDELSAYTLSHKSPEFLHQHVVDAFGAQRATAETKPIGVAFALAGLCLQLEHGFTGRQVQRAHMKLAGRSRSWPTFALPADRGAMTAVDVLAAPAGDARDAAIGAWCGSVWAAYADQAPAVRALLTRYDIVPSGTGGKRI